MKRLTPEDRNRAEELLTNALRERMFARQARPVEAWRAHLNNAERDAAHAADILGIPKEEAMKMVEERHYARLDELGVD